MPDDFAPASRKSMLLRAAHDHGCYCYDGGTDDIGVSGPAGDLTVSLSFLRRLTSDEPFQDWPALISDHLATALAAVAVERSDPLDLTDFARVQHLLRTRIYPDTEPDTGLVSRPLAPGLTQRLVLDQVHTVAAVHRSWLADWPVEDSALFDLAEHNVHTDGPAELYPMPLDGVDMAEGLPIASLSGPEYLTTHLRWLDAYPVTGAAGAAVTLPAKNRVFAYPINDLDTIRAVTVLARLSLLIHADAPYPISPWVYWWHDGILDRAAVTGYTDDGMYVMPDDAFHDLLNTLPPPPPSHR